MNMNNFGIVDGRMARDPKIFTNADDSRKVMVSVAAQHDYKSKDGKRGVDYLQLEAFIPADKQGNGAFDYLHKGDRVAFQYTVKQNTFEKNGKTIYNQVLSIEKTNLKETKKAGASDASSAASAAAVGTPMTPDDMPAPDEDAPFGE